MSSTDADPRSFLVTTWVSQASAKQRCGRTGRVFEGVRRPRAVEVVCAVKRAVGKAYFPVKSKEIPIKSWFYGIYIYIILYIIYYILYIILYIILYYILYIILYIYMYIILYIIYIYIYMYFFRWFSTSPCLITIWWYINNGFLIMFSECPRRWKSRQLDNRGTFDRFSTTNVE